MQSLPTFTLHIENSTQLKVSSGTKTFSQRAQQRRARRGVEQAPHVDGLRHRQGINHVMYHIKLHHTSYDIIVNYIIYCRLYYILYYVLYYIK